MTTPIVQPLVAGQTHGPGETRFLGAPAQKRGHHALRCLERRPMPNVLQRRERCVRESLADALGHVRAGDRVEHSPDEGQRYVGRLEYLRPALAVLAAVLDVADQEMRVR